MNFEEKLKINYMLLGYLVYPEECKQSSFPFIIGSILFVHLIVC